MLFGATELSKDSQSMVDSPRGKKDEETLPPEWKETHDRLSVARTALHDAGKLHVIVCAH